MVWNRGRNFIRIDIVFVFVDEFSKFIQVFFSRFSWEILKEEGETQTGSLLITYFFFSRLALKSDSFKFLDEKFDSKS